MKYKVGDKVRVRKDLEIYKDYGGEMVTSDMAHFRGKEVTIIAIDEGDYIIEEDGDFWTDEMFEPVITNWDKVKEEMRIEDLEDCATMTICNAIHRTRKKKDCAGRACSDCRFWLKQPYKEPSILDEAEKKYLSAVIRPWRDRVVFIKKVQRSFHLGKEYIKIKVKDDTANLPDFDENTMYKGMELEKEYSLQDLEI